MRICRLGIYQDSYKNICNKPYNVVLCTDLTTVTRGIWMNVSL